MLRNAIENAVDSQMCPPWYTRSVLCKAIVICWAVQLSMQWTVRHTPQLQASGDQDQYYISLSWHVEECNWECSGQSDVPPVKASGGQDQYYVRSAWHSAECNWEGSGHSDMRYELLNIQEYVGWSVLLLLFFLLLLLLNVAVLVHLWLWINNYSWTRTTTKLHSNNNTNLNKKIAQFM